VSFVSHNLVLRQYRVSDSAAVWQAIDESRTSLERWVPEIASRRTHSEVEAGLQALLAAREERLILAIADRRTGQILGEVGLYTIDREASIGEIGYWLRETARHRGLMAEALPLVIAHAMHGLGLQRLEAHIAVENAASIRVVERLGFRGVTEREPVARQDAQSAGISIYVLEQTKTRIDQLGGNAG
jgi:RimJ/RimL family protein N-acetyltransferase